MMTPPTLARLANLEYRLALAVHDLGGLAQELHALADLVPECGVACLTVRGVRRRLRETLLALDGPVSDAVEAAA